MTASTTPGECRFLDFQEGFSATGSVNNLPWDGPATGEQTLIVTMPDPATNMRLTRKDSGAGHFYSVATVEPATSSGAAFAASEHIEGYCTLNKISPDDLRAHNALLILKRVYRLPENRAAFTLDKPQRPGEALQDAPPPSATTRDQSAQTRLRPKAAIQAITRGRFDSIADAQGRAQLAMPITSAPAIMQRGEDGYHLTIASDDAGLQQAFADLLVREKATMPLTDAMLAQVLSKLEPLYRKHHRDSNWTPLTEAQLDRIAPIPTFEGEALQSEATAYPADIVIAALQNRNKLPSGKRLQWVPQAGYGQECLRVQMPNPATDLLLTRTHDVDGAHYLMYAAHPVADGADQQLVQATQELVATRMQAMESGMVGGGISGEMLRYELEAVLRLQSNQQAARPQPVRYVG